MQIVPDAESAETTQKAPNNAWEACFPRALRDFGDFRDFCGRRSDFQEGAWAS
jgi:hypothetical protein